MEQVKTYVVRFAQTREDYEEGRWLNMRQPKGVTEETARRVADRVHERGTEYAVRLFEDHGPEDRMVLLPIGPEMINVGR